MPFALPGQLKVVVSPATDGDPPTAPIATIDHLYGINPPPVSVAELSTPASSGAVGDGIVDDTVAYQKWLDSIAGGAGYGAPGTYLISGTLLISGNTTIYGSGRGTHIIKKAPGFPGSLEMMRNRNRPTAAAVYSDNEIALFGIGFDGSGLVTLQPQLSFIGTIGLTIRDCGFASNYYMCIAMYQVIHCTIDNNRFENWGKREADHADPAGSGLREGGPAIYGWDQTPYAKPYDVVISNNVFANGQWGALGLRAERVTICNNEFRNLREYGLYGGLWQSSITDNKFVGIVVSDVSNHGTELSGIGVIVANNTFTDVDGVGVMGYNMQDWTISGNIMRCKTAGVWVRNVTGWGQDCQRTTISNNIISDPYNVSPHGILLSAEPATGYPPRMSDLLISGNILSGTTWTVSAIYISPDYATTMGARVMIRNNMGVADDFSVHGVYLNIPLGTSGVFRVGGVGFKAQTIDFHAVSPSATGASAVTQASLGYGGMISAWDIASGTTTLYRDPGRSVAISWASDSNDTYATFSSTYCVNVLTHAGTPACQATLIGVDDDGFTLSLAAATTFDVIVMAICHA